MLSMYRLYLKIAWRNSRKNAFHSLLNVLGLSIGIGFSLLIGGYVWNELRINRELRHASRHYIIQSKWKEPNMGQELTSLGPLAKSLREQYPNLVANYYRWDGVTSNVSKGDRVFREGLQLGDSTLLTMYGFPMIHGDPRTALNDPFSLVITENRAKKYFGKTDVIGQTLTIESFSGTRHDFMITGVLKDIPENSVVHLTPENDNQFYLPASSIPYFGRNIELWSNPNIVTFIELQDGVRAQDLVQPMQQLLQKHAPAGIAANLRPYAVPLQEYYLNRNNGLVKKMLFTVSIIALFILLMAVINFINVSISRSATRIREIGVRKVMGGIRIQLVQQFLTESVMLAFFATIIAVIWYQMANPFLSGVLGKKIPEFSAFPVYFIILPFIMAVFVGFLAGIYPAWILSALKAVDSIKGKLTTVKENIFLRKSLVAFQFFTASLVLVGAIVITRQVTLFFTKDLGYDKEYVVSAPVSRNWSAAGLQHMKTVRDEFEAMPEVSAASISWEIPNGASAGSALIYPEGKDSTRAIGAESMMTDENYLRTYGISLLAGRYFEQRSDSFNIVINQSAATAFGWKSPEEAINKKIFFQGNFPMQIIGVVKDFHFGSLKERIPPITISTVDLFKTYRLLSFKLKPGNVAASLAALQKKWSVLMPGVPFDYNFMDDALKKIYLSEMQLKKAAQTATLIAVLIVLLGVIGLISLSIQKRTKEIGIRKVLGASAYHITSLFLKEYLPVILVGGIVSIPVAYYLMQGWLNDYAYRISITAVPFLLSILSLGILTAVLISLQIARAAVENPVKNLRTE